MKAVVDVVEKFPPVNVDIGFVKSLQRMLFNLGFSLDARRWVSFSIFSFLFVLITAYGLSESIPLSIGSSIVLSLIILYIPFIEEKKMESLMEAELPQFLRDLGTLLSMQIPFVEAIELLSRRSGIISKELVKAMREIKRGASVPAAISSIAERLNSNVIKRAFAQVITAYEHGGGSSELKRAGDDLLNTQRYKLKEYASKLSIFGLLFIMFSTVVPTFYIVMSIVGSVMFQTNVDVGSMRLVLLIILPSISYVILLLSMATMPPMLVVRKKQSSLAIYLGIVNALVFLLPIDAVFKFGIAALTFFGSIALFLKKYLAIKRVEEIEKQLPNALLIISSMPKGTKPEDMFYKIGKAGLGPISEEFMKAANQLKANVNVNIVLADMVDRINSPLFNKVIETITYSLRAGGNVSSRIAELADDLLLFFEVNKEKTALLSMQKYTLIAGILLMPLILSISINLVKNMADVMEISVDFNEIIFSLLPAYMLMNIGIVSSFCASMENKQSKELIYFSVLSTIVLLVFIALVGGYV